MILDKGQHYYEDQGDYVLKVTLYYNTRIIGGMFANSKMRLCKTGNLYLTPTFRWNGSNVVIDSEHCMRASAFHDALYELISIGAIENTITNRRKADIAYYRIMREDGMPWYRAETRYIALRLFGWTAIKKGEKKNDYR